MTDEIELLSDGDEIAGLRTQFAANACRRVPRERSCRPVRWRSKCPISPSIRSVLTAGWDVS